MRQPPRRPTPWVPPEWERPSWWCFKCGWRGPAPAFEAAPPGVVPSVEEQFRARAAVAVDPGRSVCPNCGQDLPEPERERIVLDVVAKLREADLSVDQLRRLSKALESAGPDTTARDIGKAVPKARKVVAAAKQLSPTDWIALLAVLVGALIGGTGIWVAHSDAEKARASQEQQAKTKRTSQLTQEELRKLSERVAEELQRQKRAARKPPDGDTTATKP